MEFHNSYGNQHLGWSDLKNSMVALFYAHPNIDASLLSIFIINYTQIAI